MKHTKGKWVVVKRNTGTMIQVININNVAHVYGNCTEAEANAKLIAAAPELLGVCLRALENAQEIAMLKDGKIDPEIWGEMELAIKKATS